MHNRLMSNVGPFFFLFFFFGFVSIFACGLRFSQQTLPCIFFRWFALRFREITYAKNSVFLAASFGHLLFSETKGFFCFSLCIQPFNIERPYNLFNFFGIPCLLYILTIKLGAGSITEPNDFYGLFLFLVQIS